MKHQAQPGFSYKTKIIELISQTVSLGKWTMKIPGQKTQERPITVMSDQSYPRSISPQLRETNLSQNGSFYDHVKTSLNESKKKLGKKFDTSLQGQKLLRRKMQSQAGFNSPGSKMHGGYFSDNCESRKIKVVDVQS